MSSSSKSHFLQALSHTAVFVSALGYFVDIYDLILCSIVRVPSLRSLGVPESQLFDQGVFLINAQMIGMLLGGILWGVLGDRRGRVSILFGSIAVYSVANIANAFVSTTEWYAVWRFLAGIGLAGELGAAITLVSETMPKESRGYSTTIVASIGVSGALFAGFVSRTLDWKTAYIIGGVMGLLLLGLRVRLYESGLYKSLSDKSVSRGNFLKLFTNRKRFVKYVCCILIGLPIWYVIGILVTFSPEISKQLGVTGDIVAGTAVSMAYGGLVVGDLSSGLLSQWLKSRTKVVGLFMTLTLITVVVHLQMTGQSPNTFYLMCGLLGFAIGYWAIFVTMASEQFGTNLRATVTTTVPNFVRGSLVPLSLTFGALKSDLGIVGSAMAVGLGSIAIAAVALIFLKDSFSNDLNFLEPGV